MKAQRVVLGKYLKCDRLIVGVPAAEHLLRYGGEVLVHQPIQVVIPAVQPVLVYQPVLVIVRIGGGQTVTAFCPLSGAIENIQRVLSRSELGGVRSCRNRGYTSLQRADPKTRRVEVFHAAARRPLRRRRLRERVGRARPGSKVSPVAHVHVELPDVMHKRAVEDEHALGTRNPLFPRLLGDPPREAHTGHNNSDGYSKGQIER